VHARYGGEPRMLVLLVLLVLQLHYVPLQAGCH
jgi:hypothetical protein